jgi:nucleotide-binding universal stress UspA family protein/CBS-domain-containing membrane protein
MFKRILVAYDGSEGARAALRMGIDLAKALGASLSSISVEEHLPRYAASISEVEGAKEQIDEHFRRLTKEARDLAALEGVELDTLVRQGHEVEAILAVARDERVDLLILGSHGHSRITERILGSTALSVARVAPCSVLIVRPGRAGGDRLTGVERILVGLDGSPLGRLAFGAALSLAALCRATVVALTVREGSRLARPEGLDRAHVQHLGAAAEEHARAAGVPFEHVARSGHAAQALRGYARETAADLIVLGATGLEHPWSPAIGGTATVVASEAPCSVLLVRSPQAVRHVGDVMMRGVSWATTETPLADVVELLLRRDVKALPVLGSRRRVVGIITGGDLLARGDLDLRLGIKRELEPETLRARLRALARSGKSARDVMTRHVHTVGADVDLATAMQLMTAHAVKRLPVVDEAGTLVGIVSRADVLRAIAALPEPRDHAERELPVLARTVGDAVTTEVPVLPADASAETVLQRILDSPLRRVVVAGADGVVLGLISDRDLLVRSHPDTRAWLVRLLQGERSGKQLPRAVNAPVTPGAPLTAAALMAPSLITVHPEDSLVHAVRLMMQHQVKRLIVVDEAGRFRGLVDRREILRLLAGEPRS